MPACKKCAEMGNLGLPCYHAVSASSTEVIAARFAVVADEQLEAAYEMGVQDSMLRATQYERVLLDLIAELRDAGHYRPAFDDRERLHMVDEAADRAEARLREVFDSNVYGSVAMGEVYGDE